MNSEQIRKSFLEFFEKKGHKIIPSSSLIPDDPSVLLTTAGMQQFKPYFVGKADPMKDFGNKNVASIQKSFRTSDIDNVGDESHLTFFEMLGNFSFGDYFKEGTIRYAHEFITKEMKLTIDYVSVFKGDNQIPADDDSEKIWKSLGIGNIKKMGREDNFWGPTGNEGPCGPTTEIYVNGVEIWNLVFNEYYKHLDGRFEKVKNPGVDTGMGLERLAMAVQKKKTIFETDLFKSFIDYLPKHLSDSIKRVIIDHARAIVFLTADGVLPSNKNAGYILRRIARRYIVKILGFSNEFYTLLDKIIDSYKSIYPNLNRNKIFVVFKEELSNFEKTLAIGSRELDKLDIIDTSSAFKIFQSYGLPYEAIKDLSGEKAKNLTRESFDKEFEKHQELSRAGAEKKFGGHGLILNTGELRAANEEELKKVTRLHTATHLLHWALREVLGKDVKQMGSDIASERTRFDFSFSRKLTEEEKKKIEILINQKIKEGHSVNFIELPKEEAKKTGALHFFKEKYPDKVKVYYMGKSIENAFSKEFCGGPHVEKLSEIGEFKILKEEAVGVGTRRVRADVFK